MLSVNLSARSTPILHPLQQHLLERLRAQPTPSCYVLAFSGGLDSSVLLHVLAAIRASLSAPIRGVHINHHWQSQSSRWADWCVGRCQAWRVECDQADLCWNPAEGESLEAWARQARYQALAQYLPCQGALLTAHHLDDQAETLLLALMRGSGLAGLSAMPAVKPFANGWHLRPWLNVERARLLAYAREHDFDWLEDPSNSDLSHDRNFLRHAVIPLLRRRWPACGQTIARSAGHLAQAATWLDDWARQELAGWPEIASGILPLAHLEQHSRVEQGLLVRAWLSQLGLPRPDHRRLSQLLHEMPAARADAMPQVSWPGVTVYRYRRSLYASTPLPLAPVNLRLSWSFPDELLLPDGLGRLVWRPACGDGLAAHGLELDVEVGWGLTGARLRPSGKPHHRPLKHLYQELGIPPWLRPLIPQLHIGGRFALLGDFFLGEVELAASDTLGYWPCWEAAPAWRQWLPAALHSSR